MYERYRDKGFTLLSVNASWDKDSPARKFVEEYRLTFPVGRDADARIASLYKVESTPHSFFVDKTGILQRVVEGAMDEADLDRQIQKLLAG